MPRLNTYLSLRSTNSLPTPSSAPSTSTPTHVFESFLRYDFTHDPGFEEGVKKILEGHPEGKERDEAVERAKGWYYNRLVRAELQKAASCVKPGFLILIRSIVRSHHAFHRQIHPTDGLFRIHRLESPPRPRRDRRTRTTGTNTGRGCGSNTRVYRNGTTSGRTDKRPNTRGRVNGGTEIPRLVHGAVSDVGRGETDTW